MTSIAKTYLLVLGVPAALFFLYIAWKVISADPQALKDRRAIAVVCDVMVKRGSASRADCERMRTEYRLKYGHNP